MCNPKTRKEMAMKNFTDGCNCAQAVLLAFSDVTGFDRSLSLRLAAPFGGGFARQREVCGAVSGMFMVAGVLAGYDDIKDPQKKKAVYAEMQMLAARFKERSGGSIICRELLGNMGKDTAPTPEARTAAYYKKRPCPLLVGDAADILEEWMKEKGFTKEA